MMKKVFSLLVVCSLLLCGCSPKKETAEFWAMDTFCTLTVTGASASSAEMLVRDGTFRAEHLLGEESAYTFFAEYDGQSLVLSDDALQAVSLSLRLSELTDGAFDITVAPLSALWNVKEATKPPSDEKISEAKALTGYQGVSLDGNVLTFSRAGQGIDLGAVGKGFAAGVAYENLVSAGVEEAVLNFGGNVTAVGNKNGGGYEIGIRNPVEDGIFGKVSVSDASVVTSGGYERYFDYEGKRYHHIIDPRTGYPSERDVVSATVISSDHMLADALSTVFFLCGTNESRSLFSVLKTEYPALSGAVLVTAENEIVVLGEVSFTLLDTSFRLS